jgi:hypothetical protein
MHLPHPEISEVCALRYEMLLKHMRMRSIRK